MASPTLLGLPSEIKREILRYLIIDEEVEVCDPYPPFSIDQGCTHQTHHNDNVRNPNLYLFLINKDLLEHARRTSPQAVDLRYPNLACARNHLNHFTRLRRTVSQITIAELVRISCGQKDLKILAKCKEGRVFTEMIWLESKVGAKTSVTFSEVDVREGHGGSDYCQQYLTAIFPRNKKYLHEMGKKDKGRVKKRLRGMGSRRVLSRR